MHLDTRRRNTPGGSVPPHVTWQASTTKTFELLTSRMDPRGHDKRTLGDGHHTQSGGVLITADDGHSQKEATIQAVRHAFLG